MSLAISTTSIPGDLEEKLSVIAEAGFQAVELHEPDFTGFHGSAEDVAQMAQGLGLSINLLKPSTNLKGGTGKNAPALLTGSSGSST